MLVIVGSLVVLACVLGGFVLSHGQLLALWQPYELLIIAGGAFGAFLTANPPKVVKAAMHDALALLKGPRYRRQDYVDLLSMLYDIFGVIRKEGVLGLEAHIEDPQSSSIFSAYPRLVREHHLIEFTTDCLRLIVGGNMNPFELEQLLDLELENHHREAEAPAAAVMKMADALPGFGIVAAVMGIVTTMSQLGEDTSRIGMHVAGALVGTFLGILLCYGFIGPLASAMEARVQEDGKAFECVKVALMASLRGYNPKVAVEFARKALSARERPSFQDLEDHLKGEARAGAAA
ncbi:flagellar motor stator protein MotA [Aerosticca soli]|jgi:chemotaxis protein MotA|uniref:Flagellar motor rotation protein MotA n=1 Tax=Aerosticca soli TaxID=2010829 RepID=A0A2Z6E4Q5_9GAMM|nr:flagellar motor stator protein MotA [Aerosticca soli]MDI3262466.1 flagellar motor stator protein MotA [Fulvimonas sp.]BBD80070.1 flagellar motor rotation protein MotA [Aerosticca soli]